MSVKKENADKGLFDAIAADYVRKDNVPYCAVARKLRLDRTLADFAKPIGSVLEVGCGAGYTAIYLRGAYRRYVGVDYSEQLIRYADRFNRWSGAEYHCANIKEFHAEEKFDVVLMIGVLHHVQEVDEVIARLAGLLRPGGSIVVNEPQRGNPLIGLLRFLRKRIDAQYSADQIEFSARELRVLFERHGFDVRTRPQGVFSTPLAETRLLPPAIGNPLARLFQFIDPAFERLFQLTGVGGLCWNVVVTATRPDHART